jgi:hypothetical protein
LRTSLAATVFIGQTKAVKPAPARGLHPRRPGYI